MRRVHSKPLAKSEGLLIEHLAAETVAYDTESKEAHCLNPLAAAVFAHCDGCRSIEQLATVASERLGEPVDEGRVLDAVAQLEERNLLVSGRGGLSRRDVIRRTALIGAGTIASAPLITSIIAPTPAAAATPTCGTILCCPCNPGADVGQPCCTDPSANGCQCTAKEGTAATACKQCKPQGAAATDVRCLSIYADTTNPGYPENSDVVCTCTFDFVGCTP